MVRRVLVFGNCQGAGLAECLSVMCKDVDVRAVKWRAITSAEHADAIIQEADLIVSQPNRNPKHGALCQDRLQSGSKPFVMFPQVYFTGFHPDIEWLYAGAWPHAGNRMFPFGNLHSRLVAAAYLLAIPRDRIEALFNAYCYRVLGYFDEYPKALAQLTKLLRVPNGQDWGMETWVSNRPFVHVPVHPSIEVLWKIAERVAIQAGLERRPDAQMPADKLLDNHIWPVYPEIARNLGVEGSLVFKFGGGRNTKYFSLT